MFRMSPTFWEWCVANAGIVDRTIHIVRRKDVPKGCIRTSVSGVVEIFGKGKPSRDRPRFSHGPCRSCHQQARRLRNRHLRVPRVGNCHHRVPRVGSRHLRAPRVGSRHRVPRVESCHRQERQRELSWEAQCCTVRHLSHLRRRRRRRLLNSYFQENHLLRRRRSCHR